MGTFTYTASESLRPGRLIGDLVSFDIQVQDARRSRQVQKEVATSLGGAIEVIKHRGEVTWSITFEPANGVKLLQLREFLDSTEGGEPFSMDLYGAQSEPVNVKRTDDSYTEEPFMRIGGELLDWFTASIQVIEL